MSVMKRWIALLMVAGLALWQLPSQAQPRLYNQAELDALLAPIALYPDSVLSHVLVAATEPEDVREAAAWSRANRHLSGEAAVQAAEPMPWHPSVKALLAFPDLLDRMDESPQWTADLGNAFREQEPYVMDTVQTLRQRAQASGALQSNPNYSVQQNGSSIEVYPAQPGVVYVPYYDPYVVYGSWWWPAYRPVLWRPWHPRPAVFVSTHFVGKSVDWHHRHVVRHVAHPHRFAPRHRPIHRPVPIQHHAPVQQHVRPAPRPIVGNPVTIQSHPNPVRPLVDSVRIPVQRASQAPRTHPPRESHRPHVQPGTRQQHRSEPRREQRSAGRQEHRQQGHGNRQQQNRRG